MGENELLMKGAELLCALVAVAMLYGIAYIRRRFKVECSDRVQWILEQAVRHGIDVVDEESHQAKKLDQADASSPPKATAYTFLAKEGRAADVAKEFAIDAAKQVGGSVAKTVLKKVGGEAGNTILQGLIRGALGAMRR